MGGDGEERWRGGGGRGGCNPVRSCRVGEVVVAQWKSSSFSFHPSLILVSWKVSKWRVEFGFEAAQQSTLSPSLTIKPLDYTYIVHTRAGFNSPSPQVRRLAGPSIYWTFYCEKGCVVSDICTFYIHCFQILFPVRKFSYNFLNAPLIVYCPQP